MEDATVTQDPIVKERFPNVIDTDDLVFEIGKQVIKGVNLEKLLTRVLGKAKESENQVSSIVKQQSESLGKVTALSESNKLYEENNRRLDAELVKLRNEMVNLKTQKDVEIAVLKGDLLTKDEEIAKLEQRKKPIRKSR